MSELKSSLREVQGSIKVWHRGQLKVRHLLPRQAVDNGTLSKLRTVCRLVPTTVVWAYKDVVHIRLDNCTLRGFGL